MRQKILRFPVIDAIVSLVVSIILRALGMGGLGVFAGIGIFLFAWVWKVFTPFVRRAAASTDEEERRGKAIDDVMERATDFGLILALVSYIVLVFIR